MGNYTPVKEQRQHIERWHESGMSAAAFAREHGHSYSTFNSWIRRYREEVLIPNPSPAFVAVAPREPVPTASAITVAISGHVLNFETPPPSSWFASVVRELKAC